MIIIRYIFLMLLSATFALGQTENNSAPEWARGAIWYQIFLDRFENGDTSNDPILNPLLPDRLNWSVSNWTSNWFELTEAEKSFSSDFRTNALLRSYGGDLQGVMKRLDYLSQLGVEVILLTPVFESSTFHRYDIKSYQHIDQFLGSTKRDDSLAKHLESFENADTWNFTSSDKIFLQFLREAHRRKMKVVLDIIFNHTSNKFPPFQDVIKNQEKSLYANWFDVQSWDRPETTDTNEFKYKSMWNVSAFPLFKQDSSGFSNGVKQYFFSITKRWINPDNNLKTKDGIDGWHLLYINQIPLPFLKDWVQYVKKLDPNILIVGDNVSADIEVKHPNDAYLDTKINLSFPKKIQSFFIDTIGLTPSQFDEQINQHMTLSNSDFVITIVGNHEDPRLASMILNPNQETESSNAENYIQHEPSEYQRSVQKYILLFQFSFVGSSMIYYGDEAGMWGGLSPDNRKPMLWFDKIYSDENLNFINGDSLAYQNTFDSSIYKYYRELIHLRQEHIALRNGSIMTLIIDDDKGLYGYKRKAGDDEVYLIFNISQYPQDAHLKFSGLTEGTRLNDPLNDVYFFYQKNGSKIRLSPKTGLLLIPQR